MQEHRNNRPLISLSAGVFLLCLSGCFGPGRAQQPDYAANAGSAALSAYDENGDGGIGGDELLKVPALYASLSNLDSDGNQFVSAAEINTRVQSWRDSKTAQMTVTCRVLLDGTPLADARVVLEPEAFLGENLQPAAGVTGEDGSTAVSLAEEHLADSRYPGVACGWYKIRITSDKVSLPARYHSETTLGCEVSNSADWVYEPGEVVLELTSK